MLHQRRLSIAWYLLPAYLALLLYASLYPFLGWNPKGLDAAWVFSQAWPRLRWADPDVFLNFLGYMPLGFLIALALIRLRLSPSAVQVLLSVLVAVVISSGWSWLMETVQLMLPQRVSTLRDWITNTLGGASGALLAAALDRTGVLGRWQTWRSRWLQPRAEAEAALLLAWPFALLTPTAVPFALGQVAERALLVAERAGLPLHRWFGGEPGAVADAVHLATLTPLSSALCGALGLAVPAALACLAVQTRGQRLLALVGLVFLGWFSLTLSSAMSFGPAHAWAWWSVNTQASLVLGLVLALIGVWLRRRHLAVLAALGAVWALTVLNQSAASAYFWQTLQTWEQGRFIHFHGVAQWLGWLWPYLALGVLLRRALAREQAPERSGF